MENLEVVANPKCNHGYTPIDTDPAEGTGYEPQMTRLGAEFKTLLLASACIDRKFGSGNFEFLIVGMVAAMTESDLAGTEMKDFPMSCLVLTGTAPRGGQGVWLFSLTQAIFASFREAFVAEKPFQRQIVFVGTFAVLVGV